MSSNIAAQTRGPRIRWGAIVWGTVATVVSVAVLVIIGSPDRRAAFGTWLWSLGAGGFVMIGFLLVGFTILVLALLAMVRRVQRNGQVGASSGNS